MIVPPVVSWSGDSLGLGKPGQVASASEGQANLSERTQLKGERWGKAGGTREGQPIRRGQRCKDTGALLTTESV